MLIDQNYNTKLIASIYNLIFGWRDVLPAIAVLWYPQG